LRSNYVDPNLTYSNSYFELYKTIQIEFDRLELDNSNHQNKFAGLFNNKESNWFKFKKHIDKCINNEYVIALASDKNIKLVEKFNIIQYDLNINDEEIYVLIILATYGEGKPKSIEDFVNDLENNAIIAKFKDNATILLGFHVGYKKIRNYYSISNNNIPVKFELVNQLDYYTIEYVYNYVNKEKDLYERTKYEYLTLPAPEKNIIDNVKYFGFYNCNSNIIISILPEFLSNLYVHDLIEQNASLSSSAIVEKYLFTIYKMIDLDYNKKISIEKMTYKILRDILLVIAEQLKYDYRNVIEKINLEMQQLQSENIKITKQKNTKVNSKKNTKQTTNNAMKLNF
jgi:hypothetical protein